MNAVDYILDCLDEDPELASELIEDLEELAEQGDSRAERTLDLLESELAMDDGFGHIDINDMWVDDYDDWGDDWDGGEVFDAYLGPSRIEIESDPNTVELGKIPYKKGESLEVFKRRWEDKHGRIAPAKKVRKWKRRIAKGRHPQVKKRSGLRKALRKAFNPVAGIKFLAKGVKKVGKPLMKVVKKVAKIAGPAASAAFPGAGAALAGASAILGKAKKGVKGAQQTIAYTRRLAKEGNPEAQKSMDLLQAAQAVEDNQRANRILNTASRKDPKAMGYISMVKSRAQDGDPRARQELSILRAARKGQKMKAKNKYKRRMISRAPKVQTPEGEVPVLSTYKRALLLP